MTMGRGTVAALLAACGLLAAGTPSASAATAKVVVKSADSGECSKFSACPVYPELNLTAASGEVNAVSVDYFEPPTTTPYPKLVIRDAVPITAGEGCTKIDDTSVSCQAPSGMQLPWSVFLDTSDMNDSVIASFGGSDPQAGDTGVQVRGGAGDDRITGGPGVDFLFGESGADTLIGGAGADTLEGDDESGATSPDILDGGDGSDTVSYSGRRAPLALTLDVGGTEDTLNSIESTRGGRGNDILAGDSGDNTLRGGPGKDRLKGAGGTDKLNGDKGDDRLDGGAGDDELIDHEGANRLYGGPGKDTLEGGVRADRLVGGPGNDEIELGRPDIPSYDSDGVADKVTCGSGRDLVTGTDTRDLVPVDCERVLIAYYEVVGRPRRVGRSAVRVRCHVVRDLYEGGARVWLFAGRRRLGKSRTVRRSGTFTVKLNAAGRRVVRAGAKIVIRPRVGSLEGEAGLAMRLR